MGFLKAILGKVLEIFIGKLLAFAKEKAGDLFYKKKVTEVVSKEKQAVLDAKNIINQKRKDGQPILEEDYERLREANRRFNSNTFKP